MPIQPDAPRVNVSKADELPAADADGVGSKGVVSEAGSGPSPGPNGLDLATAAGGNSMVEGGVSPRVAPANLLGPAFARFEAATAGGSDAFALVPGRYPECVSLPDVLRAMGQDPAARAALEKVLGDLTARTGLRVPQSMVEAVLADPGRLSEALAFTPKQISAGFDALTAAYRRGLVHDAPPKARALPQGFDLGGIAEAPVARPKYELKELAPNLFTGDIASDLPDERAKANIVIAEVFDRLAENVSLADDQKYSVQYQGQSYTGLEALVRAMAASGLEIQVEFVHRIANFTDMKTKGPDDVVHDVPAAMLIRTGVEDSQGKEAILPASHAQMEIHVRSSDATVGPRIDADCQFFQGIDGTGFWPSGLAVSPAWCGRASADPLSGEQAVQAIELAGLLSDAINTVAREKRLPYGAYGVTGVCLDSVETVRHAMTGHMAYYPLLSRHKLMFPAIRELMAANAAEDADCRKLADSIRSLPSDLAPNASRVERMLSSIPWPVGQEAFASTVDARSIIEAAR